ncbi:hypothetical protein SO802_015868 [Lithocarpus litseifolius]|uniref:Reverse transcriptase zinc-binding domain-containing protein n=1 Tax=Lithocarpus litseifolius TaxID=425828 RepID=A0AAW2CX59_9ROSI
MEVAQSSRGSYAWQSLLKGRDVLKRGTRWRIGCGENVSVWNDAWLPSQDKPTVQSPMVKGFQEAKVSDLINPDSHKWESDLIKGLFTPQEAELILSIPLSQWRTKDKLIWPFVSSGNYIVKSGYNFLIKENSAQATSSTNPGINQAIWRNIWDATVPNKVRNFLWRVCKNAIPTKSNLVQRKILIEGTCDHCQASPETALHALGVSKIISGVGGR